MRPVLAVVGIWIAVTASGGRTVSAQDARGDAVRALLTRLERVAAQGNPAAYAALLTDSANRTRALTFGDTEFATGVTRAIIQERERGPLSGTLPGNGYQLTVDVFQEFGGRARVASWRLDLKRVGDPGTDTEWLIDDENRVSSVENLYKLSLNPKRQFRARDLAIAQDDLDLQADHRIGVRVGGRPGHDRGPAPRTGRDAVPPGARYRADAGQNIFRRRRARDGLRRGVYQVAPSRRGSAPCAGAARGSAGRCPRVQTGGSRLSRRVTQIVRSRARRPLARDLVDPAWPR